MTLAAVTYGLSGAAAAALGCWSQPVSDHAMVPSSAAASTPAIVGAFAMRRGFMSLSLVLARRHEPLVPAGTLHIERRHSKRLLTEKCDEDHRRPTACRAPAPTASLTSPGLDVAMPPLPKRPIVWDEARRIPPSDGHHGQGQGER